eukprot:GEMP01033721.1.p1 GENE.GEMP01033721.1~~GEMP01033721.1.p1  ORF type:complete len:580 (-),score=196.04 GEMP01033721.1:369-2078(-)
MANDPHSILWKGDDPSIPFAPKRENIKKKPERYWAGKVPKWHKEEEPDEPVAPGFRVANVDKQQSRVARLQRTMHEDRLLPGQKKERRRPIEAEVLEEGDDTAVADEVGAATAEPRRRPTIEATILDEPAEHSARQNDGTVAFQRADDEPAAVPIAKDESAATAKAGGMFAVPMPGGDPASPAASSRGSREEDVEEVPDVDIEFDASVFATRPAVCVKEEVFEDAGDDLGVKEIKEEGIEKDELIIDGDGVKIEADTDDSGAAEPDTDEEERNAKRQQARARALVKRKMEEAALASKQEVVESSESSESTSGESSESEDQFEKMMLKPVFVSRKMRLANEKRESLEEEEKRLTVEKLEAKAKTDARKKLARARVAEIVKLEEAEKAEKDAVLSDAEMPDDDDCNEAEEYELWKIRELRRLKRNALERQKVIREAAEVELRRNMTEFEREEDDKRLAALNPKPKRSEYTFLQKYYHKGAFFMDAAADGSEQLYQRDFNAPLAEEKVDKSALPKAMQMRRGNWGKKSQVKHTHLSAVDTTEDNSTWVEEATKLKKKLADRKTNQFERPSAR